MNINNVLKRQTIIITVTIIGICLTLVAISYAIFFNVKEGTTQIVESGDLVIQFTNDKLLEDELFPISDTKIQDIKGYNFSVTNKGSLPMRYKIYIYDKEGIEESLKTKMLSHEYIKVQLDNYPIKKLSELTNEEGKLLLQDNLDVKAKGTSGDVKTHTIKVWIDEEAPEETVGNIIALDIEVEGVVGERFPLLNEIIVADNKEIFSDEAGNIRYAGEEPNNYIWFNCDNYNGITQANAETVKHCEKWQIIGLFKDIKIVDDQDVEIGTQNLVKIIRTDKIGDIQWDDDENDWTNATLKETLNNETDGYITSNYSGVEGIKGITSKTKNMIKRVKWNIGSWNSSSITTLEFYNKEKQKTWNGYIGLMNPSDYGYATGGSKDGINDRNACLNTVLSSYDTSNCYTKNWLFNELFETVHQYQWTINSCSYNTAVVFSIFYTGKVSDGTGAGRSYGVRPVLYLNSSIEVQDNSLSDGSEAKPYILLP